MTSTKKRFWNLAEIAYMALVALGLPAAAFHLYQGRYGNAIMAALAVAAGVVILSMDWRKSHQA